MLKTSSAAPNLFPGENTKAHLIGFAQVDRIPSQLCMTVPKPERSIRNQKSHEVVTKCDKLESEFQEFCKCAHITTFHPISSDLCRWIVTQLLNPRAASCSPVIRRSESVRNSPVPKMTTESMDVFIDIIDIFWIYYDSTNTQRLTFTMQCKAKCKVVWLA